MQVTHDRRTYLAVTLGLYRSASTWVFNVAEKLLIEGGDLKKFYTDHMSEFVQLSSPEDLRILVKTHKPDEGIQALLRFASPHIVLTVRDPVDCVASLMRQFYMSYEDSLKIISESAAVISKIVGCSTFLLIRYEDEDARGAAVIQRIAAALGVDTTPEKAAEIALELSSENVKAFIDQLSEARFFDERLPTEQVHPETQWHPRHVGEGKTGEVFDVLRIEQVEEIRTLTSSFRALFGY